MTPIQSLDVVLQRARSPNPDDRESAARELMHFSHETARSTLLELIGDLDWRVRRAAVESLCEPPRTECIPLLLEAIEDETNAGRRNAALDVLSHCGSQIVPYLGAYLKESKPDIRMFLVNLLGDLRDRSYVDSIIGCLKEPEENLVSAAILALGKIGDASAIPYLIEKLQSNNLWYRFQAIEAAGEMQDPMLLPHIISLIESPYCRKAALHALAKYHHPEAYRALIKLAFKNDTLDPDVIDAVSEILRAPQPVALRKKDSDLIQQISEEILDKAALQRFKNEITKLVSFEPEVERKSPEHLTTWPDFQTLLQIIKDEDPAMRHTAIQQMMNEVRDEFREPLMAALADEDPTVRGIAARALASYESPEVTDALLSSIQDEEVWVRLAIYESLPKHDSRSLQTFMQQLERENPIGKAVLLRCLGKTRNANVVSVLLTYLKNNDPELRASACEAIGFFQSKELIEPLSTMMIEDRAWNVRNAAIRSLVRIQRIGFEQLLWKRLEEDPEPVVKKAILEIMTESGSANFPDIIFDFLEDPQLADAAYEFLSNKANRKDQILQRAETRAPTIRRIVHRIFG
jgi:HEAT repeat protein